MDYVMDLDPHFTGITLVIPAFEPGVDLVNMVTFLSRRAFRNIVVVDDGSGVGSQTFFEQIQDVKSVKLLRHPENRGKGAALKSAFRFILEQDAEQTRSIITLDADGQHTEKDVVAIARRAAADGDKVIMGVRSFSGDVPLRSRFGNLLTRCVLRWVNQIELVDTQTGLRCLPLDLAKAAIGIAANGYEFELECILLAKRKEVPILQHPIQTIYKDSNASSHFRPVIDSLHIYMVFARYVMVSIGSFILDISLFTLIYHVTGYVLASTYVARVVAGSVNFYYNKNLVFHSRNRSRYLQESFGYLALAGVIATLSGIIVYWLTALTGWYAPLLKILVDVQLFVVSFLAQRYLIFGYPWKASASNSGGDEKF